jgi:hypothetical protein
MEARLAKLKQAEQAEAAQVEAEARRAEAERRRQDEEWAQESERKQEELEQERERQRLAREQLQLETDRKEQERREREEQERREAARRVQEAEEVRVEAARREAQRKESLENRGLAYYPRPTTQHDGRNAEEWYRTACNHPEDSTVQRMAETALAALKEEGAPFLLDSLQKQSTGAAVDYVLRLINIDYVPSNDLQVVAISEPQWARA